MQGFKALLIAAGLLAAPTRATAGPCPDSEHSGGEKSEASSSKGRLGVYLMSMTPELRKHFGSPDDRGVMVARVQPLTPASIAGLQAGDILTEVSGRKVSEPSDVVSAIATVAKDQKVALKLVRDGKSIELSAKMTSDPTSFLDLLFPHDSLRELFRRYQQDANRTSASNT